MKYGFVKVGLCSPNMKVGATDYNTANIITSIRKASGEGCELVAFGSLSVTSQSCRSMFRYPSLLASAEKSLIAIAKSTTKVFSTVIVGLPITVLGKVYACSAVINAGTILALIPHDTTSPHLDNYLGEVISVAVGDKSVPFGKNIILNNTALRYSLAVISDDELTKANAQTSATLVVNTACSYATIGSYKRRQNSVIEASRVRKCGYCYISSGLGESVSGSLCSGDKYIAECGELLSSSRGDDSSLVITEIDIENVSNQRLLSSDNLCDNSANTVIEFDSQIVDSPFSRRINTLPLVPNDPSEFEEIIDILSRAILTRMKEIGTDKVIFGLSGGLDSTCSLIILNHLFTKYQLNKKNILAVTMRGLASSSRTQNNSALLIEALGVTGINIPINDAVLNHLKDIGHTGKEDIVYENAQARERAQILFDLSNKYGALVIGTGDLSEIALGWSTYGGDQLAQFNPNSSLSKTMIRAMMRYYTLNTDNAVSAKIVGDILATPISPELKADQNTEEIIGPYELNDFFLYNLIGKGFSVEKVVFLTQIAFPERTKKEILSYLKMFVSRFFVGQFKRVFGCDGVGISQFDLSKIDLRSDFNNEQWLTQVTAMEKNLTENTKSKKSGEVSFS